MQKIFIDEHFLHNNNCKIILYIIIAELYYVEKIAEQCFTE